jgi:hypothetical protein
VETGGRSCACPTAAWGREPDPVSGRDRRGGDARIVSHERARALERRVADQIQLAADGVSIRVGKRVSRLLYSDHGSLLPELPATTGAIPFEGRTRSHQVGPGRSSDIRRWRDQ